jgi:hypothetical protein
LQNKERPRERTTSMVLRGRHRSPTSVRQKGEEEI